MSNVPDIRFKGFTDAWEQRELGDIVDIYDGTHQTPKYTENGIKFLSVENISDFNTNKYISEEDFNKEFKVYPERDDILMTRIGSVGLTNVISTDELYAYYVSLALLKNNRNNSPHFINFLMQSNEVQNEIWKRTLHIAFPKKINKNEIGKVKLFITNYDEQLKIGKLFEELNETITLLQRELDLLKIKKNSYVQMLFPRVDNNNPYIRLNEYEDDWYSVKLESISSRVTRKNKNLESKTPLTISALHGLVDQTEYFSKQIASIKLENYLLIKNGEFAYNKSYSNGYPYGTVKRLDNYEKGVLSSLYIIFELIKDIDSNFIKYYFETDLWHKDVQKKSAEGARNHGLLNITAKDFLSINIKVPKDIHEQIKIGQFFTDLDRDINNIKREINVYQQIKKAFLQKLFPKGE
ncbi:restriction endonuclease subunit S [Macrococcus sp. EM39E]|uniref:restriction endonuclease subunit S n=1 Tax=Macrococcus animalis TaxID=3395467 RepID=UPI0039BE46A9